MPTGFQSPKGHSNIMWLSAVGIGLLVVVAFWGVLFLTARLLPPGRTQALVAFGPNCVVMLRRLRKDHRLPLRARLALGAAFAYLVSPVQIIPNIIPVIGQTDDVLVSHDGPAIHGQAG